MDRIFLSPKSRREEIQPGKPRKTARRVQHQSSYREILGWFYKLPVWRAGDATEKPDTLNIQ